MWINRGEILNLLETNQTDVCFQPHATEYDLQNVSLKLCLFCVYY